MAPGGDRVSLRLSDADEAMIAAVASASDRVAVIVQCGSAVMMPWADSVRALLVSWYPGVEGGNALADMLTGVAEPGGRLPFAIPTDADHLVPFDKDATAVVYDLLHGQWKLDADGHAAHFPFGAGAGYTTWAIGGGGEIVADGDQVSVEVTNTGDRAGSTVVFAFGGMPGSAVVPTGSAADRVRPRRTSGRGSRRGVGVDLDWSQLDVRRDGTWWTEPGDYVVTVGLDASDTAPRGVRGPVNPAVSSTPCASPT